MSRIDLTEIKAMVDEADPLGLLALGAPIGEYAHASSMLRRGIEILSDSGRLVGSDGKQRLLGLVHYVFNDRYAAGKQWPHDVFVPLADRLAARYCTHQG